MVVNGVRLDDAIVAELEGVVGWSVADGAYWYDPVLGAVGFDGEPTGGFIPAGLPIGGPLRPDASNGTTGVFLNGRELPTQDLVALEELFFGFLPPDAYFLDAQGNYGYTGGAVLGNVFAEVGQQSSGDPYIEGTAGGWIGSDGSDSYYFDPDSGCSVMADGGLSC